LTASIYHRNRLRPSACTERSLNTLERYGRSSATALWEDFLWQFFFIGLDQRLLWRAGQAQVRGAATFSFRSQYGVTDPHYLQ